jgi:hypothetical protein
VFWLHRFCALTTAWRRFRAGDPGLSASPRGWCVGCAAQTATERTWSASVFDDWTPQTCLSSPALPGRWPRAVRAQDARFGMSGGEAWRSPRRLCRLSRCAGPVVRCSGPARGAMASEGMRQRLATRRRQLRRAGPFSPLGVCPGSVVNASEAEPAGLSRRSGTSL